MFVIRQTAGFF